MDAFDRKILYALDRNSRASFAEIAKAARLKQETVRYRVNRLLKDGTIRKFLAIVNSPQLGFSVYQLLLRLQNVNDAKKREIIGFLVAHPRVGWVADVEGNYDIAFIVSVRTPLDLQSLIDTLDARFSSVIMKRTLSVNLAGEFLPRDYLVDRVRTPSASPAYVPAARTTSLEAIDERMLVLLGQDARQSCTQLGSALQISADSALARLRRLREGSILTGFTIAIDPDRLSSLHYKLLLYLNVGGDTGAALVGAMRLNARVTTIVKSLAEWSYEVDLEVESITQLKVIIMEFMSVFSDRLRDYQVLRIAATHKFTLFPSASSP
jgi:DNA-binding Lrp family transcriptional regulator